MTLEPPVNDVARPAVLDDRSLLGHPRGLGLLFVVEMWERFSYYGMRAILVPYLVQAAAFRTADANNLYGTYTSLVYLTPLVGGYLADRVIGTRRSLVLGGGVIALGHFALALPGMAAFYSGLGLIIAGTGFFKPNAAAMVGQMYRPGDARRDSGFTIYYMGVNAGAFLGPLVVGFLAESPGFGWHWGFAAAGIGMVIGLIVYLWGRDRYLPGIGVHLPAARAAGEAHPQSHERTVPHAAAGGAVGLAVAWLAAGAAILPLVMGATIGAAVAVTVLGTHGDERKRVLAIFLAAFFVVFFWAAYEQAGSSMNLFAFRNTALPHLLAWLPVESLRSWRMPASWFQSFNPVLILVFAPAFAALWSALGRRGREPSTATKMVLGLALLGIGFVFMAAGGRRADGGVLVSPMWLVLAYAFHTWGELCLSPVGLSYVSRMAPARYAALLMGAWYLANAAANKIAGALAALTPAPGETRPVSAGGLAGFLQGASSSYFGFFSIFVVTSLSAAAVMLLFVPLLNRLAGTARTPSVRAP
ncbi:MAG TPA: peptide MFS transporter [Anaeromyxobacteraceae bacterium]|nr:peptide MFS transporter [Anaeromyxobacteraceae bacterium]